MGTEAAQLSVMSADVSQRLLMTLNFF